MRLIDADAEIAKIEQEIQKTKSRIKEWEENREDRGGYHNIDEKISKFKNNILQAQIEIKCLKGYSTAYDVDKVVELDEERYTIEQIIDAIVQVDEEIIVALSHKDREMLEDVLKDFL